VLSKEIGITVKKGADLSEWYTQLVTKSEMADYASVKGFMVLMPYGYSVWEKIRAFLDARLKEMGHSNAYFPVLIPESFLKREAEHFSGFTPEVFWVTRTGSNDLAEPLAVRPTSETVIYDSYAKWVRSWRDLPLLINAWNSVLRAEIKATKPFMRTSEFLWQEGHTVHADKEDTDAEVMRILELYRELIETQLAIPTLVGLKTDREKFVGALYTTTLESMMPDGKALQMGTSHNLGQNFSKAFEIKYLGKDEQTHYAWNSSWGVSWRLIGALVMVHGDDRGLVMPPKIAPIQAVIVPIPYKNADAATIIGHAKDTAEKLRHAGVSVFVDDREQYTPGWKFNEWELKGIPIRIEIGPRDISRHEVTVVRRDTSEKSSVPEAEVVAVTSKMLDTIQSSLFEKANRALKTAIRDARTYEELKRVIDVEGGFVRACWCSDSTCEEQVKDETGATIRVVSFKEEQVFADCVRCGKKANKVVYFARAY
jgi:prolyl-tRNA synthetase